MSETFIAAHTWYDYPRQLAEGVYARPSNGEVILFGVCNRSSDPILLAELSAEQTDALIRALAAARVEISKEPPK